MSTLRASSDIVQQGRESTLEGIIEVSLTKEPHKMCGNGKDINRMEKCPELGTVENHYHHLGWRAKKVSCYWAWVRGRALGMNHQSELCPHVQEHSHYQGTAQKGGSRETKFLHLLSQLLTSFWGLLLARPNRSQRARSWGDSLQKLAFWNRKQGEKEL